MSTALTVPNGGSNAVGFVAPPEDLTGLSSLRQKPSIFKIIQPTAKDYFGGKPGMFLDTNDNSVYESLNVIPLRMSTGRALFPTYDPSIPPQEPLCKSNNGLVPSPFVEHPVSSKCGDLVNGGFVAHCPNAKWNNRKPPVCSDNRMLMFINTETELPCFIQFKGVSVKPYETGMGKIASDRRTPAKRALNLQLYDYMFTLKTAKSATSNTYHVVIDNLKQVPEPGQYFHFFDQYVLQYLDVVQNEEDEATNENTVNDAVGGVVDAEFVDAPVKHQAI